jgi:hypothetical protein
MPIFLFASRRLTSFEMGYPLRREDGFVFLSRRHTCCDIISHEYPVFMQRSGKGICTLWEPHTFCHFTIMNNTYTRSPQRCLHLVVVVGLVRLCDPESNAGGSLTTNRATHAGKVKG